VTLLRRQDGAEERMDSPAVDRADLDRALRDLGRVNRWTGARRALLRHLPRVLPPGRSQVLDVGTGAADLPLAIAHWAARRSRSVTLTAVDRHAGTVDHAAMQVGRRPGIRLLRADALHLPFPAGAFDLAVLSMTLHHLDGPDLVRAVTELGRVARGGYVLVGELERCVPNYVGARVLAATVWRASPITRHDGPLSVLRAFTPGELGDIARRAGLRDPRVHRHPLFRLVLTARA
jgi:ubiquinone/menaquinone biosynthesis C-methylase UbiE